MAKRRKLFIFLALTYAAVMAALLFFRELGYTGDPYLGQLANHFNPIPFRTIGLYLRLLNHPSRPWLVRLARVNLFGNVLLFIPLGLFPPLLWTTMRRFWKTILLSAGIVTVVELLQMLLLVGTCDIDDLLLNVLGAALGYGLYRLARHQKTPEK